MTRPHRYTSAKRATVVSAVTNSLLAFLKIVIGYIANSQVLIADGLHSASDLITDALVLVAAKAGGRSPDKEHPYGHQRIETFASIIISIALIVVGAMIIVDTFHHLKRVPAGIIPEIAVICVAVISIVANELLFRYMRNVGKRIHSNLLISNAWHNRSDAMTSLIVLIAVIGTLLGFHYLDSIGAIIIALLIARIGIKMMWNAIQELIDRGVDQDTHQQIFDFIQDMPGVHSVHQLRTRLHGGNIFVDLHIIVNPYISVSEGHYIGEHVHAELMKKFPSVSDVVVHIDAEDDEVFHLSVNLPNREQIIDKMRQHCQQLPGFAQVTRTTLHYLNGKIQIEIFLPYQLLNTHEHQKLSSTYNEAIKAIPEIERMVIYYEDQH